MNMDRRSISIVGATGSIGTQCLDIVQKHTDKLRVVALAANRNADLLIRQARMFDPEVVAIADRSYTQALRSGLEGTGIRVLDGDEGVCACATLPEADIVLGAASGIAGLKSVLAALEAGKVLALANKETLVAAGDLAMRTAKLNKARIVPVDSEHAGVFQCLEDNTRCVEKIILTASGGPFRKSDRTALNSVTPKQALKHPNWNMGAKVTIDSATMMNKGLEVIEAYWLFGLREDQIEVVVHPQSIVHAMVLFEDGSLKAQLSMPDMRLPIQYALSYPDRWSLPEGRVDWTRPQSLTFAPPDLEKFPCLRLAREALDAGGNAPTILNAANEAAVDLFLKERLGFMGIPRMVEEALGELAGPSCNTYEEIQLVDQSARQYVFEASKRNTYAP
ncbi:MAG: 1-deoxy-D-xylulose-5-phosphate reductoisomerase [Rhodothermaceae bacterium]|nr:1-deoxy-D-xylulose-5-phosphate reductoisomerase [Rhodothermaceae bacterium]MXX59632.1 1-deoxy-D-xylulose-5-phosphate reductoisomerase [Rhodothermaceae bacterium]MXZ05704.1 1-deoxy-D-xylulose-5-phosphate reductoisomerase [Rhodothermaceae bacterium]MYD19446.1 1-deoxy-D-xylulose-5-phosphate reductoisomerase [Rhodothermaceae bacterium]MYD56398.1 1-deoxy-D-xylulose-5-phosphate reductoisomerase [Rhodothermaceae bacterium]